MKRWTTTKTTVAGVLVACLLCCATAEAKKGGNGGGGGGGGATYSIIPFDGGSPLTEYGEVLDLNDEGHAVGWVSDGDGEFQSHHLNLASGIYTALPGNATAINNHGHIVGNTYTQGGGAWPNSGYYMSSLEALPVLLPPLADGEETVALDINDDQVIVGRATRPGEPWVAVAWRTGVDASGNLIIDGPVPLFPFVGDLGSMAFSVNDPLSGPIQIVGYSKGSIQTPVNWSIELNGDSALSSSSIAMEVGPYNAAHGVANAVNALGDICGDYEAMPFVVGFDGSAQALSFPRNTQKGWANDINDLGETVGKLDVQKITRNGTGWPLYRAHLWRADGTTVDLETLIGSQSGWDQLWGANQINNSGVMAGKGRFGDRDIAFIMTPN